MADGSDRLPWLDEPRSQPASRRRGATPWLWSAAAVAILGVGAGAYWLGTRDLPPPAVIESAPPPRPQQVEATPEVLPDEVIANEMANEVAATEVLPAPPALQRTRAAVRAIRESAAARSDEPVAEQVPEEEVLAETNTAIPELPEAAPMPITRPTPVIVRTPGQSWGRKVQLGAYRTQAQADVAWRALVRRYPYLASKPKLVSGLDVRSTDGKATRMYRLQLAAASQAQAVVICQRLQKAGQSCVVVY